MADRIVLNTISYHGHGAIENIVPELTARGYKKAFVCSDPDLIKFGVTKKVTDLLDAANFAYAVYSEISKELQEGENCIISCGGGVAMREQNVVEMKKNGRVVLLTASPETIYERVKDSNDRPILNGNKNVPFITDMMEKRREKYEAAADVVIQTDNKSILEISEELISKLTELDEENV